MCRSQVSNCLGIGSGKRAERGKGYNMNGHEKTIGGDGYIYHLDYNDDPQMYTYVKTYQIVHFKYGQCIVYQLYFIKAIRILVL